MIVVTAGVDSCKTAEGITFYYYPDKKDKKKKMGAFVTIIGHSEGKHSIVYYFATVTLRKAYLHSMFISTMVVL
jgi:hypothetical protein